MPLKLERKLAAEARKKHFKGKRKARFIYGTLRKVGWKPKRER